MPTCRTGSASSGKVDVRLLRVRLRVALLAWAGALASMLPGGMAAAQQPTEAAGQQPSSPVEAASSPVGAPSSLVGAAASLSAGPRSGPG